MSRYIDSTNISKEISDIKKAARSSFCEYITGFLSALSLVEDIIDDTSTADVVEVVRCKDCKYYIANYCTRDIKGRTNMFYMTENDYCSYGERREE
jgi:hypothetical protein